MSETHPYLRETNIIGRDTRERLVHVRGIPAVRDFGVFMAGHSLALTPFQFVRTSPSLGQLLACLSGRGEVFVDDRWMMCEAGFAYLTPARARHAYRCLPGEAWELCWVQFSPGTFCAGEAPELLAVDANPLNEAVLGLHRESAGAAEARVLRLWMELVCAHATRMLTSSERDQRLAALWRAVEANLAQNWTVASMAKRCGIGSEHLRRLCQAELGTGPLAHLTAVRMRHAAALLASDAYTVASAAHHVGYSNPFAFSTAFKRVMGLSPAAYRGEAVRGASAQIASQSGL